MDTNRPKTTEYQPTPITRSRKPAKACTKRGARKKSYRTAWQVPKGQAVPDRLRRPAVGSLSMAPDKLQARALEKYAWIQKFVMAGCPRGMLEVYARERLALGTAGLVVPRYSTLRFWVERFIAFGFAGLVDTPAGRRQCPPRTKGKRDALTPSEREVVETTALSNETATVIARLAARGQPARARTIYHAVRRLRLNLRAKQPHAAVIAAEGRAGHRARNELAIPRPALPAGLRLTIDSTTLDHWIQAPGEDLCRIIAMRPTITIVADEGSRRIITFGVFLRPVTSDILRSLMARAFVPGRNWPGLPTVQIPLEMNADLGSEHQKEFLAAMKLLGVRSVKRAPSAPKGGARVERLHETLQTSVLAHEIGYSKRHSPVDEAKPYVDRKERRMSDLYYEPFRLEVKKEDLLSLRELEEKVRAWAVRYNDTPHQALSLVDATVLQALGRTA